MTDAAPIVQGLSIAQQLVLLAELSNIDQKAKAANDKLDGAAGPAKKLDDQAALLKKNLDDAGLKKEAAEKQKRVFEAEVQDERIKIKKWEARADELRGEREHAALSSEIGTAKRVIRQAEEKQLEQMEAIEAVQEQIVDLTSKHKRASEAAAAEWKKAGADLQALKAQVAELQVSRAALLSKLPGPLVKRYDVVAKKRGGVGVAIIRGEVCGSCGMHLPPQMCIQVRKGILVAECNSCSRVLVHEAMTVAPAPPVQGPA